VGKLFAEFVGTKNIHTITPLDIERFKTHRAATITPVRVNTELRTLEAGLPPSERSIWYIANGSKEGKMKGKKYTAEQIVAKLREAEVLLGKGVALGEVCRQLEITDVTYYRWKKEYGGLRVDQAKRLKELEAENNQLKKAVADLTLDNMILKEVSRKNF
jgi:transposase-like protein